MIAQNYLVLCAFVFFQGAWSKPATVASGITTTPSYGSQFQADFSKNLATIMNNFHNGASSLASPPIKFGMDIVPNLFHQGVSTATDRVNKITTAGKEGMQKIGVGAGNALGGVGVLGSSIAGGAMNVAGHGLGVGVDVADAGAKAGIDFLGHLGDNAASGISVGTTIGGGALSTLGNTMIVGGTAGNVVSSGLATLLDVIGSRLSNGIGKLEQVVSGLMDGGVLKLENGALSFSSTAQAGVYNILNSFLQILVNVQKLFDSLKIQIDAGSNTSGTTGSSTNGTSGTTSGTGSATTTSGTTSPATKSVRGLHEPESEEQYQTDKVMIAESEPSEFESAEPEDKTRIEKGEN